MKSTLILSLLTLALCTGIANAEVDDDEDEDVVEYTHSIRRGKPKEKVPTTKFEYIPGSREIEGDGDLAVKVAKRNWKAECKKVEAELKAEYGAKLYDFKCGSPRDDMDSNAYTPEHEYKSTASYYIRVPIKERLQ